MASLADYKKAKKENSLQELKMCQMIEMEKGKSSDAEMKELDPLKIEKLDKGNG